MSSSTDTYQRPVVPARRLDTPYPLIDSDPHIRRVVRYARPSDWGIAALVAAFPCTAMWVWERVSPSYVGRGGMASIMRLNAAIGIGAGFIYATQQSSIRFYGMAENKREQEMDMREMVDKVKQGEPLYGTSTLTPYMQGVASRNSRYSGLFLHVLPVYNFVNHDQHGVDTAKYYQQAERELETERQGN